MYGNPTITKEQHVMSTEEHLCASALFNLEGLVAVVTGGKGLVIKPLLHLIIHSGGTGIGLMISRAFAVNGATVYITGRREEKLRTACESYKGKRGKLIPLVCDVTDQQALLQAAEKVKQKHPRVHILVNNAGYAPLELKPIDEQLRTNPQEVE